VATCC